MSVDACVAPLSSLIELESGLNPVPPFLRLPEDVKSLVLRFHAGVFKDDPALFVLNRRLATRVCASWRAASLNDVLLWSHVYLTALSHRGDIAYTIGRGRKADLSVHIYLDSIPAPDFFAWLDMILSSLLPRCVELTLSSPDQMLSLTLMRRLARLSALCVRVLLLDIAPSSLGRVLPLLFEGSIPSLHTFTMQSGFVFWPDAPYFRNLRDLRLFDLDYPTIQDVLDLLRSCPRLVHLQLHSLRCMNAPPSNGTPLVLLHLTHLRITKLLDTTIPLLPLVSFPALKTLYLEVDDDSDLQNVYASWKPLLEVVTSAILSIETGSVNFISGLLAQMPSIRRLDLRPCCPFMASAFCFIARFRPCIPHARVVILSGWLSPDNLQDIFLADNRRCGSDALHLLLPRKHTNQVLLMDCFAEAGTVRNHAVLYPIDYWADPVLAA
ncbi:hypothetical protein B0H17DRAFT_1190509 [Mycena rosella]|uniref:F-box domain-containing protein n=1 Tax=Mycena rosella TaxID=1033263 RepID=A0AAD7MCU9_MYCRO|nr:hypothetical protein B0H17DRAFT_1190509 [Mycena rosella]